MTVNDQAHVFQSPSEVDEVEQKRPLTLACSILILFYSFYFII